MPPILFGSHIDSVPGGGNFDGDLGSLSSLGVLEALAAAGVRTRHPLEMVVWAHEESFAFGRGLACSRIVAGDFAPADLDEVWNGLRRADAIRKIGGNPDRMAEAQRPKGSHHCYLELHIEQGGTLERARVPVGVVEGIVAIDRYDATITGVANHAGTTPIAERHDAMLAAAHLTVAVREAVTRVPGRQVGTVGHIEVTPNSPNVIPGLVRLSVELRDLQSAKARDDDGGDTRPSPRDRRGDADDDRVQDHGASGSGGRGAGDPGSDRARGEVVTPRIVAPAERRRTRCADDGAPRADGDDLRAERRRRQPFAEGADGLAGLRATAPTSCCARSSKWIASRTQSTQRAQRSLQAMNSLRSSRSWRSYFRAM